MGTSGANSSSHDGISRATTARKVQAIHIETVHETHVGDLESRFGRADVIALQPTAFDHKALEARQGDAF